MCRHDLYILEGENREISSQIIASSDEYNCIKAPSRGQLTFHRYATDLP
jgi:hypothetical protein